MLIYKYFILGKKKLKNYFWYYEVKKIIPMYCKDRKIYFKDKFYITSENIIHIK